MRRVEGLFTSFLLFLPSSSLSFIPSSYPARSSCPFCPRYYFNLSFVAYFPHFSLSLPSPYQFPNLSPPSPNFLLTLPHPFPHPSPTLPPPFPHPSSFSPYPSSPLSPLTGLTCPTVISYMDFERGARRDKIMPRNKRHTGTNKRNQSLEKRYSPLSSISLLLFSFFQSPFYPLCI